jgi:phosphoribosyl-ATP pyrophosphohydrolase/phosphoribosyl-AMP cyclohydrolase
MQEAFGFGLRRTKMNPRKFIASLYIYHGHGVKSLKDRTIVSTDPVKLAHYYSSHQADGLLVFDMVGEGDTPQERDRYHEEFILILREICSTSGIDVMGAGGVKRMEDIKKLLYAGCRWAVLDFDQPSNIAIAEEVGQKFGAHRLIASYSDPNVLKEQSILIEKYVSGLLLMTPHKIRESKNLAAHPVLVQASMLMLNKLIEVLSNDFLWGITGNVVNENIKELPALKKLCKENGIAVDKLTAVYSFSDFQANAEGLVPVVVQEEITKDVLMVAYMNEEAYLHTLETGRMTYYSRSRRELWEKGATSGHYQYVKDLRGDCDMDTILATVTQIGAACHTGAKSCFFQEVLERTDQMQTSGSGQYLTDGTQSENNLTHTDDGLPENSRFMKDGQPTVHGRQSADAQQSVHGLQPADAQQSVHDRQPADGQPFGNAHVYRSGHNPLTVLTDVYQVIADRKIHPKEGSYTNYLFEKGLDKILKKLGEEATEIVIAAKNPVNEDIKYEIGDFLYHMMVLMVEKGVSWEEITEELAKR